MPMGINYETRSLPGRKCHGLSHLPLLQTGQYGQYRAVNALADFAKGKLETNETFLDRENNGRLASL